jgi:hypothetical protein
MNTAKSVSWTPKVVEFPVKAKATSAPLAPPLGAEGPKSSESKKARWGESKIVGQSSLMDGTAVSGKK